MKIGPPLQPFDPGLLTFSRLSKTCVTCVYAARESQPARCGLAALALGPNSALAVAAGLLFNSTPPPPPRSGCDLFRSSQPVVVCDFSKTLSVVAPERVWGGSEAGDVHTVTCARRCLEGTVLALLWKVMNKLGRGLGGVVGRPVGPY